MWAHDYEKEQIIKSRTAEKVSCSAPEFNQFASVSLSDLATIATILRTAKISKRKKEWVDKFIKDVFSVDDKE